MEILSPSAYLSNANRFTEERTNTKWTQEENKMFENALAVHDRETADRWQKVADMIPGKTVSDVMSQYKELVNDVGKIEAGLYPSPDYSTSPFTLDWVNSHGFNQWHSPMNGKRSSAARSSDQERKKGVPWTEEEHK